MRQDEPFHIVNKPKHYNSHPAGIECIEVIEHLPYNVGAAIKYLWRAGQKDGNSTLQDLAKSIWHLNREIDRLGLRKEITNASITSISTVDGTPTTTTDTNTNTNLT